MKKLLLAFVIALMALPMVVFGQCGTDVLTAKDADNITYQSLKVGPHCWMQTNLKTNVPGSLIYRSDMYPDTNANLQTYGRLYPWSVAAGDPIVEGEHHFVKGVCPEGWHLPLNVEVQQLMSNSAPSTHSVEQWLTPGTNTTGFNLLPGGFYKNSNQRCENLRGEAYLWSIGSNNEPVEVWSDCHCDMFVLNPGKVNNGLNVRCVYKIYQAQVATNSATNIKAYQADLNGNVIFAGYDKNYSRGFVYGTDPNNPTVDTVQHHFSEEGTYSYTIEDLQPLTTYYYRAYVKNEFDIEYGPVVSFTTLAMTDITQPATNITMHTAKLNGEVTSLGGYNPVNVGFLYGLDRNNLTDTAKYAIDITNKIPFSCDLSGLTEDTQYFFCAYITNGKQVEYGDTLSFYTAFMEVATSPATELKYNAAQLNGELTQLKVFTDCQVGFKYGQRNNPLDYFTTNATKTETGDFSIAVSNLSPNTKYFFQAYAAKGEDTVWAPNTLDFTTPTVPCEGKLFANEGGLNDSIVSVKDKDNNEYIVVRIGDQCWMAENLRATSYQNGDDIILTNPSASLTTPSAYNPKDNPELVNKYGLLYNYYAVEDERNICPAGWHVPTDGEWFALEKVVLGLTSDDSAKVNNEPESVKDRCQDGGLGKLATGTDWYSTTVATAPGNMNYAQRNSTGFCMIPTPYWADGSGEGTVHFWSSTPNVDSAWSRSNTPDDECFWRASVHRKSYGFSVRCLRDPLTVTTDSANTVTKNSATLYGNVTSLGKYTEAKAGFRYGNAENNLTTKVDKQVTDRGSFNIPLTSLILNTTYFYQAYATNGTDTAFGVVKNFTTPTVPCLGAKLTNEGGANDSIVSVKDNQGNEYIVVRIGDQCWMAQNLRVTSSPAGNAMNNGTAASHTKSYYAQNTDYGTEGYLYNWRAAMDLNVDVSTITSEQSNHRGLCPQGWHIPTQTEWNKMDNIPYFKPIAAGFFSTGNVNDGGVGANFTTATATSDDVNSSYCKFVDILHSPNELSETKAPKSSGLSIRCLRDPLIVTTDSVSSVTKNSATLYGNVTSLGKYTEATAGFKYGACISSINTVVRNENVTSTGKYSIELASLNPATTYYYAAFVATNTTDTVWGDTLSFSTYSATPCEGQPIVKDHENNEYATVAINDQCWMAQNLRVTSSPAGNAMNNGTAASHTESYYAQNTDYGTEGYLYNWRAAMDLNVNAEAITTEQSNHRGLCPQGWHIPTQTEWGTLNNVSDFHPIAAGYFNGNINAGGVGANFTTATPISNDVNSSYCKYVDIQNSPDRLDETPAPKSSGLSIRCIRGPFVTTDSVNTVTENSATLYGNVTSLGICTVATAGFKYGACISSINTVVRNENVTSTGKYSIELASLNPATTYYYAAFVATNTTDTVWGDTLSFSTYSATPCEGQPIVKDHENNEYATVAINGKCWMAQNLRVTTSVAGYTMNNGAAASHTESYYAQNTACCTEGYLYNWRAAMDLNVNAETITSEQSNHRGLCPQGWHIPTQTEWETFNNVSDFHPIAAGYFSSESINDGGLGANFWTATAKSDDVNSSYCKYVNIKNLPYKLEGTYAPKSSGLSVRCLRDADTPTAFTCGTDKVKDFDLNEYNTVAIGNQCWMKENLRTTKYADGTAIAKGTDTSTTTAYRYYPNNDSSYVSTYGYLYNWKAVMNTSSSSEAAPSGVQGICPAGWHVPSDAEWDTLTRYVYNSTDPNYKCSGCSSSGWVQSTECIANALSAAGWTGASNCNAGSDQPTRNQTGFSAVPAGTLNSKGVFDEFGISAYFWSATLDHDDIAWFRGLHRHSPNVGRYNDNKVYGFSVRCLRNSEQYN